VQHGIDLYATQAELSNWLAYLDGRFGLHFAFISYRPQFGVDCLPRWTPNSLSDVTAAIREVWIDTAKLDSDCSGQSDCLDKNGNRLALQLPQWTADAVRGGTLYTLTDDPGRLKVWQAALRYFRKQTTAGMWVVDPLTQAKGFYRNLRYSVGVANLANSGLQLLPFGGSGHVFVNEPGAA